MRPQLDLSDLLGEFELPAPYQAPGGGTPGPTEITPPGRPDIYTAQAARPRRPRGPRPTETPPGRPPIYTAQLADLAGQPATGNPPGDWPSMPLSTWTKKPEDAVTIRELLDRGIPFTQIQNQLTQQGVNANRKLNELFK